MRAFQSRTDGIFSGTHGSAWDKDGNLYVQDWNVDGRIMKLVRMGNEELIFSGRRPLQESHFEKCRSVERERRTSPFVRFTIHETVTSPGGLRARWEAAPREDRCFNAFRQD